MNWSRNSRYCVILSFLVAKSQMFVLKGEFFNKIIVTDNIILQSFTRILKVLDLERVQGICKNSFSLFGIYFKG